MINALSYNLSWATQANKVSGSEADFVETCQSRYKKGGFQCTTNAVNMIGKLPALDLVGLQEVNSDVEKRIIQVQPSLKCFERGKIGSAVVSIIWNPTIFGNNIIYKKVFNLSGFFDLRPCLVLVLEKEGTVFILSSVHMPHSKTGISKLQSFFSKKRFQTYKNARFIMMGDFNDHDTHIHKNRPITLKFTSLKHLKNKKQTRRNMKSCCWHKPGHKYKHYSSTGDYILVNKHVKQKSLFIPGVFRENSRLASDHKPVFSKLIV
jgi:endonuclease/exonuclease/phosphatase family metal-dependent hydrolase